MYTLSLKKSVKKDFKQIHPHDVTWIKESLYTFVNNFSPTYEQSLMQSGKIKKLQGNKDQVYRLKLRSYRVIYQKEEEKLIILVINVKSREGAYQ
jgi:mRNA interferase RelE/StbE